MRQRIEHRPRHLAAVVQDALELDAGRRAVLQLKVGLAPKVGRPELRRGRVIVRPDRLQQFERARRRRRAGWRAPPRSPAATRESVSVASGNRFASSFDRRQRLAAGAAEGQHAAGPLERDVVAAQREPGRHLAPRLGALSRPSRGSRRPPSSDCAATSAKFPCSDIWMPRRNCSCAALTRPSNGGRVRLPAERRIGLAHADRRLQLARHRLRVALDERDEDTTAGGRR